MRATYKVSLTSVATFLGAAAAAALALDLALFFPPFLGILLELGGVSCSSAVITHGYDSDQRGCQVATYGGGLCGVAW